MKLFPIALIAFSSLFAAEMSVCNTEELLPIGFTEEELTRLSEIGTYQDGTSPPPAGVRNPGEFEPATGVMVRWPLGVPYDFLIDVSNNSELWVICSSSQQGSAESALSSAGVNMSNTDFITAPTNSIWVRDYGPWFIVLADGTQGIFDYDYNRPRPLDDVIPQVIGDQWGIPVYISDIVHTGGNYMSSGLEEAMSTNLVYAENSNPDSWVDQQMEDYLGISGYTTFVDPQASYIDHIDCWSKILSPDRIMVLQVPPSHGDYAALEAVADLIASSPSPYGHPWDVYRVFSSGTEGYVNGLLHNDTYYMPVWNTGNDSPAEIAFSEALPGYTITPMYFSEFQNTDALHCRSRNVIDRYMLQLLHTPVDTVQSGNPVVISAFIQPDPSNSLTSKSVFYRVDSGSYTELAMTSTGSDNYSVNIPSNPDGSLVEYYIKAEDSSGRVSAHPQSAPATWFNHYTVSSTGIGSGFAAGVPPQMLGANPFSSMLAYSGEPGTIFSVFDASGRKVHSSVAGESGLMEWHPEVAIPAGVYFAHFLHNGSAYSARAVLLR
ncbi:MAG: agmatine deiminase family protein [Candidatus Sabulitectum sp.]|nr:agmatine deiminase family protein [Candidatus Sabulitectum sp.]